MAAGAARQPAGEYTGDGEPSGDEGVLEVPFRPRRRSNEGNFPVLPRGKCCTRSAMTNAKQQRTSLRPTIDQGVVRKRACPPSVSSGAHSIASGRSGSFEAREHGVCGRAPGRRVARVAREGVEQRQRLARSVLRGGGAALRRGRQPASARGVLEELEPGLAREALELRGIEAQPRDRAEHAQPPLLALREPP